MKKRLLSLSILFYTMISAPIQASVLRSMTAFLTTYVLVLSKGKVRDQGTAYSDDTLDKRGNRLRDNAQTYCNNLWAPMNTMKYGVDLTNFDIYATHPGFSDEPLIELTCDQNRTWINSVNGIQYNIPDQFVGQPVSDSSSVTETTTKQSLTTHQLKEAMSGSLSKSYVFGLFSKSISVSEAFQALTVEDSFWQQINSSVSSYKVSLTLYDVNPKAVQLSSEAISYIESNILVNGAEFNEQTASSFYSFFKYFGTHWFQIAHTGGSFHMRCDSNKLLLEEMAQVDINAQGQINFLNFLKISGAVSGSIEQLNAIYKSLTTTVEECRGGTFCPTNSNDYDKWQISVASTPWILSATFEPMYKLINFNKTLQDSFETAIQNHQQLALLDEINANIDTASNLVNLPINITCSPRSCEWIETYETIECEANQHQDCSSNPEPAIAKKTIHYHSYVTPSTFNVFHNKLLLLQSALQNMVADIKINLALLSQFNIITNETLFNQTAQLWSTIVNATQSGYTWDYTNYTELGQACQYDPPYCKPVPCSGCHKILIYNNLTYFASWPYMFYLL